MAGEPDLDALLRAFAAVLELEQHALVNGEVDNIAALAAEKAAYIEQLARRPSDGNALDAEHERLVANLRRLNEENGRLVAWRISHLRDRLAALSSAFGDGLTYDSGGNAQARLSRAPGATGYG